MKYFAQLTIVLAAVQKGRMAHPPAKRKRTAEPIRVFHEIWTEKFYFVEHNGNPHCLLCGKDLAITSMRASNLTRHYET